MTENIDKQVLQKLYLLELTSWQPIIFVIYGPIHQQTIVTHSATTLGILYVWPIIVV